MNASTIRQQGFVTIIILAGSLALNVYLGVRLKTAVTPIPTPQQNSALKVGDRLPPLQGVDLSGQPVKFDYTANARHTILYVVSPSCSWCHKNEASMTALIRQVAEGYNVVVISLSDKGAKEYVEKMLSQWGVRAGVTVVTKLAPELRKAMKLGGTPQTFVIDTKAVVVGAFHGAFTEATQPEVETYFKVKLPGISAEPPTTTATSGTLSDKGVAAAAKLAPNCKDTRGREFSLGWRAVVDGKAVQCGPNGKWLPQ